MTLGNLGYAYAELRRFEEAIACYQQDIMICREVGDRYGKGRNLDNLASSTRKCGGLTRRRGAGGRRRRRCVMPVTTRRPGTVSSSHRSAATCGDHVSMPGPNRGRRSKSHSGLDGPGRRFGGVVPQRYPRSAAVTAAKAAASALGQS
jgi:hypothetical protein